MQDKAPLMCEITFRNAAPRDIAAVKNLIPFEVVYESSYLLTLRGDGHALSRGQRRFLMALAAQKKLTLHMEYTPIAA